MEEGMAMAAASKPRHFPIDMINPSTAVKTQAVASADITTFVIGQRLLSKNNPVNMEGLSCSSRGSSCTSYA
jgi:hypothetical protein